MALSSFVGVYILIFLSTQALQHRRRQPTQAGLTNTGHKALQAGGVSESQMALPFLLILTLFPVQELSQHELDIMRFMN